jgi:hypothetical protein
MRDKLKGAGHITIGDRVEKIGLGFAPPYANYRSDSVFADFLIPSFHIAREFIELPGELVQIAANRRLKQLNRGSAYPDLQFRCCMVGDPFRDSVASQRIKL